MLSRVQNIAFKGIYDLMVPENTSRDRINAKAANIQKIIDKNYQDSITFFDVRPFNDRVRIVSAIDNPHVIVDLFQTIGGKDLAEQYVARNIQQYNLNIQA